MSKLSHHPMTLHDTAYDLTNNSVVIAGPGRTGTRLLGSLFQSLENTEFLFEPLMLYALVPQITHLPEATWKLLYETYLVEEFLLNALAGRFLNFNKHDYSYVLISKSEDEINNRMARSHPRNDDLADAPSKRLVVKVPDLTPFVPQIMAYYPDMVGIVMIRNPDNVIGSLVRKESYSDQMLSGPFSYPPYKRFGDYYIPAWIPDVDLEKFSGMSIIERCAYSYVLAYEGIIDNDRVIVIDYDDFKIRPRPIFRALCEHLGGSYGPKTEDILGMVKEPEKHREFSWEGVSPEIRDRVYAVTYQLSDRVSICGE